MKTFLPKLLTRGSVHFRTLFFTGFLLICSVVQSFGQAESNNMVTYDTVYLNSGITWTFRITRPVNMFTANHPDTASRPVIISMPGVGEVGTDPSFLTRFGPHYWLQNGWDGSVQLSNGTHYPILITIITSATNVRPGYMLNVMNFLLNTYHIKRNSVHVAGLSMGGFTWGRFICYAASTGDERAMSLIKSYTSLEGVANDNFTGFDLPGWTAFGHWAKKYGGKFFGLEGTNDTRGVWNVRDAMQDSVPGSAYFSYEKIGGGSHCCWNSMYDPSATDWQCVPTITSGNIGINTLHPNSMGTYTKGENIFQWMLRQGDTTLVTGAPVPPPPPTISAGSNQTISLPATTITLTGTATANGGNTIASTVWSQTAGPACSITSANNLTTTVNGLAAGTYTFTLTVKDNTGQTSTSTVTVTVLSGTPPTVNAGTTQTITLPVSTITLTGTATANGGATITSTAWSEVSGPNAATVNTPGSLSTQVSNLVAGSYVFTLKATDNNGNSDSSTVQITVNNAVVLTPPTVNAGAAQIITLPVNAATLTATATANGGASIATTAWSQVSGPNTATIASPASLITLVNNLVAGTYVFRFKATDNNSKADSATVQVTVNSPAPVVTGKIAVGEGEYQCYFLDANAHLWGVGNLSNLGTNGTGKVGLPQRAQVSPIDLKFVSVAGGLHGGAAVDENGYVWVMGDNDQAQHGAGDLIATQLPRKILVDSAGNPFNNVASVVAFFVQNKHNGFYAVKTDGTLWVWGRPLGGMRGNGTDNNLADSLCLRPVQVYMPGNRSVKQIVAGDEAIALCTDGTVWTWGPVGANNLGYPMTGNQYLAPHQLVQLSNIVQIAGGRFFNYALTASGVLYGWGQYGHYMGNSTVGNTLIATPTILTNITGNLPAPIAKIVTNSVCTHAILTDGSLWGWGDDAQGNIGDGRELDFSNPGNGLYAWTFYPAQLLVRYPVNIAPTIKFADVFGSSVFTFYTYALDQNGQLYCWGRNKASVLANGIVSPNPTISADYANAWDVPWPQKVDPFGLGNAGKTWVSTCPACVTNGSNLDCSTYPVPSNTRPVANAGANQNITSSTTVLDASGSTDNVHISYYIWRQISGPNTAVIDLPGNAVAHVSGLVTGLYRFRLRVIDNGWLSDSTTVDVAVNAGNNLPPVAVAGPKQNITLPTNTTTLDGTKSSDPDGSIIGYAWSLVSGPIVPSVTNPSGSTTTVTGLSTPGTYIFKLTVTDNFGATANAMDTIIVTAAANQPPISNAGVDQSITLPVNTVTLNGSSSQDPGGSISSYAWAKVSGPTQGNITTANGSTTTVTGLAAGTYIFTLLVTDNGGLTDVDSVTVVVLPAANQPPVANAGSSKTITLPTNSTTVDASASSDPDGTIASYAWSQVSGPSTAIISNGSAAVATTGGLVAGTYIFQVVVTDNNGATAAAQVKVTVVPTANQPPIANAGVSKTIVLPVNSTTLDGSASADPDGSIASYSWTQLSGPSTVTITNANSVIASVGGLIPGVYVFQLSVTDNSGATSTAQVNIIVAAANNPPVANAGADITITLPANSVTLDGTASADPSGTITSYAWSQISGPSSANLANAGAASTTAGSLVAGTYQFKLTIQDNNGASASDTATVVVLSATLLPPIANAGADINITLPVNSVTVNGSASQAQSGTITGYNWVQASGPSTAVIANAGAVSTAINGLVKGTYVFKLTVTDNNGKSSTDSLTVVVNASVNKPPVASAGANKVISLPTSNVTLDASGSSDPDGSISSYSWTQVSGPSSAIIVSNSAAVTSVNSLQAGVYIFSVTVTDNSGATATSQVKVTVLSAQNQPPVANAGADQSLTLPNNSTTLDGSLSADADGTITLYNWQQLSGPAFAAVDNYTTPTTGISGLQAGTYTFRLTVVDNQGASTTDDVTITVVDPAGPAVAPQLHANAGRDTTMGLPASSLLLNGTASYATSGTISGYSWTQVSGPNNANIATAQNPTSEVTDLTVGDYVFLLTVTDNAGHSDTASVKVKVVNNLRFEEQIKVFPNPATDIINLRVLSDSVGDTRIDIFNMNGQLLQTKQMQKDGNYLETQLYVQPYAKGVYNIRIAIGRKKLLSTQFIKL